MFDRFGEMGSAAEINELAVNLKNEGDHESLKILAEENGIDPEIAQLFIAGDVPELCNDMAAAIGKIEIEAAEMKPTEIIADWVDYLRVQCFEDQQTAKAVRAKGKSLKGAIAELLKWSWKNCYNIDKDICKAAGVQNNVKMGIPGMGRAKQIMTDYYLGR